MMRDKKLFYGILVIGIFLAVGWWILNSHTSGGLKSICGPNALGPDYDTSYCTRSCNVDDDCKFTCGCGAINKNEICHDEGIIYDCVDHVVECKEGLCIPGKELSKKEVTIATDKTEYEQGETVSQQITKEKAINIANQTEEVKEFLRLYPDVQITSIQDCCAEIKVYGGECKCIQTENDNWLVVYRVDNESPYSRQSTSVKFAVDSQTGEILARYPKPEYIRNSNYCESDEDCKYLENCLIPIGVDDFGDTIYAFEGCLNFISWRAYCDNEQEIRSCKCIDSNCTTGK